MHGLIKKNRVGFFCGCYRFGKLFISLCIFEYLLTRCPWCIVCMQTYLMDSCNIFFLSRAECCISNIYMK